MKFRLLALLLVLTAALGIAGCSNTSAADRANDNLSKAAENFEVQRRIVGINGINSDVLFTVEGFCSIENDGVKLDLICKVGKDLVERTTLGLSDNVTYVSTQLAPEKVDFYRPKIIFRPKSFLPDVDIATGEPGK